MWVIQGGPRCGPCFRLARWIEEHHATIDKDYVVVKLMGGIDEHVTEALAGFPSTTATASPGLRSPNLTALSWRSVEVPLGNTGYPTTVEDLRHFRQMLESTVKRLTPDEVNQLIESLGTKAAR